MATVTIAVTGTIDNGAEFFSAKKDNPLTISLGGSELPPAVEKVLATMEVGDIKKVRIPPEEGYGARQKDLLQTIENRDLIERIKPVPGMLLTLKTEREGEQQEIPATVIEVEEESVTVDYNHPLAGHHLTYELELLRKE